MQKPGPPPPSAATSPPTALDSATQVSIDSVHVSLQRVLACESFAKSPKHRNFLQFVVGEALAGRGHKLKEYTLGVEVFGRPESFDSSDDPIVRVTASRVRAKLKAYFDVAGADDPVAIELPRGHYVPVFKVRSVAPLGKEAATHRAWFPEKRWSPSWTLGTILSVMAIVACLLIANRGPVVAVASAIPSARPAEVRGTPAIVVLPFVAVGGDPEADYSAKWLTVAVTDILKNVDSVPASFYSVTPEHPSTVGQHTNDAAFGKVLQGWVGESNGHLRVTAQLIDLHSGFHVWSDVYECDRRGVFGLQHEIARGLAGALHPRQHRGLEKVTADANIGLEARNLYLDGLRQMEHQTPVAIARAVDYFYRSTASDPQFSLAYSHLASAYIARFWSDLSDISEVLSKAQAAAAMALRIAPDSSDGHCALAVVKAFSRQWIGASSEFAQAIKLDPERADLREQYALNYLLPMGRLDEALEQLQKAKTLDPASSSIEASLGSAYYYRRNYEKAIEHCTNAINLQADYLEAFSCLGSAFEQKAMFGQAKRAFAGITGQGNELLLVSLLGHNFGLAGGVTDAQSSLEQLSRYQYVPSYQTSLVYLGLGRTSESIRYLEKAYEENDPRLVYLAIDPKWDHLRSEPRFMTLIEKMGLSKGSQVAELTRGS